MATSNAGGGHQRFDVVLGDDAAADKGNPKEQNMGALEDSTGISLAYYIETFAICNLQRKLTWYLSKMGKTEMMEDEETDAGPDEGTEKSDVSVE